MIITLGVITLVGSTAVGLVYNVTKAPIEAVKRAKTVAALSMVLPGFDGEPAVDTVATPAGPAVVYTAKAGGQVVGYAVESATDRGFGGRIRLMTGFTPEGEIIKIEVLEHNETPGLGDKIEAKKSNFSVQFQGKSPATLKMLVRKDGGEVDAITASTISSRAYIDAVNNAWQAFQSVAMDIAPHMDTNTGATSVTGVEAAASDNGNSGAVVSSGNNTGGTTGAGGNAGTVTPADSNTGATSSAASAAPADTSAATPADSNTGATSTVQNNEGGTVNE